MAVYVVLSFAKFANSTSLINKKKSFMKILNKMGFNIEPCGTQKLLHLLINHIYEVLQKVNHEEYS